MVKAVTFELMNTSIDGIRKEYKVIALVPSISVHSHLYYSQGSLLPRSLRHYSEIRTFRYFEVLELEFIKDIEERDDVKYDIGYLRSDHKTIKNVLDIPLTQTN